MQRLPLASKLAYSLWIAVWVPAYVYFHGASNFLWLCDLANFVVLAAIWTESSLLFSAPAVGVLLVQLVWAFDFFAALLLGVHPLGATTYMFEPVEPLWLRLLSLFHLVMPVLLIWALRRLGYDRRGLALQTALTWVVLPVCYLLTRPEDNINWIWKPFNLEQIWLSPPLYLVFAMLAYPLLLFLPTHAALARWSRSWPVAELERASG